MDEIINSQTNLLRIDDFLNSAQIYAEQVFPDLNVSNLFKECLSGNIKNIINFNILENLLLNEINIVLKLMVSVLIILIIHSIFKAIIENLGNSTASQIVFFLQYLVIVTVVINSFVSILDLTKECIGNVVGFMNMLVPILITLMLTTGNIATTSIVQPILIIMINFIGNFINLFIIPMLLISLTISIISNISNKIQIERISNFLKSSIIWILGIILTIFSCTLSLEGTLTSSVDGLTSKTAKAAVSTFIPVVGKIMGDTVESVIGCGNILKNSVGMIGIIIISGIVILPVIKITVLWIAFKLTSGISELVADTQIVKLMDNIADSYKILFAILISVAIMFIVGITIVIKITNSAIMYR